MKADVKRSSWRAKREGSGFVKSTRWNATRRGAELVVRGAGRGGFYFMVEVDGRAWNSLWSRGAFSSLEKAQIAAELFVDAHRRDCDRLCLQQIVTSAEGVMGICKAEHGHDDDHVPGWELLP